MPFMVIEHFRDSGSVRNPPDKCAEAAGTSG